jgi:hypothetical protein
MGEKCFWMGARGEKKLHNDAPVVHLFFLTDEKFSSPGAPQTKKLQTPPPVVQLFSSPGGP